MEHVRCGLCLEDDTEFVTDETRFGIRANVVRCRQCGLVYLNPRPDVTALNRFYKEEYRRLYSGCEAPTEPYLSVARREAKWRADLIDSAVLAVSDRRKALDIGCAEGTFLSYLPSSSWDLYGVEPNPLFASYAAEKNGVTILGGFLEQTCLPDSSFDVITLWHVLEHLADPVDTLASLRSKLKPGGVLFGEVPNVASFQLRSPATSLSFSRVFYQTAHLYYFSAQTLREVLRKAGFEPVQVRTVNSDAEFPEHVFLEHLLWLLPNWVRNAGISEGKASEATGAGWIGYLSQNRLLRRICLCLPNAILAACIRSLMLGQSLLFAARVRD